jgi:hypothetical protein
MLEGEEAVKLGGGEDIELIVASCKASASSLRPEQFGLELTAERLRVENSRVVTCCVQVLKDSYDERLGSHLNYLLFHSNN